jgi:hypothetical protein
MLAQTVARSHVSLANRRSAMSSYRKFQNDSLKIVASTVVGGEQDSTRD